MEIHMLDMQAECTKSSQKRLWKDSIYTVVVSLLRLITHSSLIVFIVTFEHAFSCWQQIKRYFVIIFVYHFQSISNKVTSIQQRHNNSTTNLPPHSWKLSRLFFKIFVILQPGEASSKTQRNTPTRQGFTERLFQLFLQKVKTECEILLQFI